MTGRMIAHFFLALTGVLGFSTPALSQDVTAPCGLCTPSPTTSDEKPAAPVKLDVEVNLDFDRLVLAGAGDGSAELGPDGVRNVSGSIASIGARAMVGEVVIHGEPGRYVRVELPRRIELQGFSGGVIRLESLRSDLPQMPRLDGNGRLRFRLGGVLHLTGDVSGTFRGDVTIDVDYL
jgi:Domain of unknown function (DUF4402)